MNRSTFAIEYEKAMPELLPSNHVSLPTGERVDLSVPIRFGSLKKMLLALLSEFESLAEQTEDQSSVTIRAKSLQERVQRYEAALICRALAHTHGNQQRAARLLGVKATTLNCKIKRYGINPTVIAEASEEPFADDMSPR
jgi:DNA-binding NtrC family response regulator